MSILEEVRRTVIESMKAKAQVRLDVARMTQSALQNKAIEKGSDLVESEEQKVVATLIKQRKESIEQFQKAGRDELAAKEAEEIEYLATLLPPPLGEAEIAACIDRVIKESGAAGPQDFGKVMKPVMSELGTRVDGKIVKQIVQDRLS